MGHGTNDVFQVHRRRGCRLRCAQHERSIVPTLRQYGSRSVIPHLLRITSDSLIMPPSIPNIGSHMGFDATRKLPSEGYQRGWPELVRMDERVRAKIDALGLK